jgi:putative peptide zinc metalloprotease protein
MTQPALPLAKGDSAIRLHSLRFRQDGQEWIVGRAETGTFIAIPQIGMQVIESIQHGRPLDDIRQELESRNDQPVDVVAFVNQLIDLGFVAAVDDHSVAQPPLQKPSLPWLRPRHVRWTLSPILAALMATVVIASLGVIAWDPDVFPSYRELFWTDHESLILLGQALLVWAIILVHEIGHLATARAADVPAHIRLGTRLQFLVAQTDVSGIWTAPRRHRFTVYGAGMAIDLTIASLAILAIKTLQVMGIDAPSALPIIVLMVSSMIPLQFLVFMRTDVYFILQDLARCRNLYADGSAYVRDTAVRLTRRRGESGSPAILRLPRHEQVAVRCYAVLLVLGTSVCMLVAGAITIPTYVRLIADSIHTLFVTESTGAATEAIIVILIILGFQLIWLSAWWRRHGERIRRWFRRSRSQTRITKPSPS